MKWLTDAEEALSRVPFFVRKRVKHRVEEEAVRQGASEVRLEHVGACQKKFLGSMDEEVKGYQVETCFGSNGCPNRAVHDDHLARRIEEILARKDLRAFLKERVNGPLKLHHEFRVSISDCPNACSRPQIVDVGFLGARQPVLSTEPCTRCGSCTEACREEAITLPDDGEISGMEVPTIDPARCLFCGQCIDACPSGTLQEARRGYRVLVGGKLGRHPQLGRELAGIRDTREVLATLERCVDHHKAHNQHGERFGEVLNRTEAADELSLAGFPHEATVAFNRCQNCAASSGTDPGHRSSKPE